MFGLKRNVKYFLTLDVSPEHHYMFVSEYTRCLTHTHTLVTYERRFCQTHFVPQMFSESQIVFDS